MRFTKEYLSQGHMNPLVASTMPYNELITYLRPQVEHFIKEAQATLKDPDFKRSLKANIRSRYRPMPKIFSREERIEHVRHFTDAKLLRPLQNYVMEKTGLSHEDYALFKKYYIDPIIVELKEN